MGKSIKAWMMKQRDKLQSSSSTYDLSMLKKAMLFEL